MKEFRVSLSRGKCLGKQVCGDKVGAEGGAAAFLGRAPGWPGDGQERDPARQEPDAGATHSAPRPGRERSFCTMGRLVGLSLLGIALALLGERLLALR